MSLVETLEAMPVELLEEVLVPVEYEAFKSCQLLHLINVNLIFAPQLPPVWTVIKPSIKEACFTLSFLQAMAPVMCGMMPNVACVHV